MGMGGDSDQRRRELHEQNRASWNAVTPAHNSHKRDQASFLAGGGSTLFQDELDLLGDVSSCRLVHLQCNCGQDTLSLSRLVAEVVGVDISDEAIRTARQLASATGLSATFHRSDVFDWFDATEDRFDVAYSTYGTIGWLSDLDRWARGVARVLRPGGRLVLLEFHPVVWSLDSNGLGGDPYFTEGPLYELGGVRDYVGEALAPSGFEPGAVDFANPEPGYGFQWTVAGLVQAVLDAGLRLETLREYPYANGCDVIGGMRRIPGNRYALPEGLPDLPLMLGLRARS